MTERLDIVVFGASGFTGKYTVPLVNKLCKTEGRLLTWGVAGRSEEKLKNLLKDLQKATGNDMTCIPIIIADIDDDESLQKMSRRAKIIINCCGPYRFYGEEVVKACIETGTHHVDVSGEPNYMEQMQLEYHKKAQEKGVYVISACGFDSIPADLGLVFLENNFKGTLNSVETYLQASDEDYERPGPSIHYGTWESAVYGLAQQAELKPLRSKLFPERLPAFKPKLEIKKFPYKSDVTGKWTTPFLGADRSVIMRSQRYFYEHDKKRPIQVQTYMAVENTLMLFGIVVVGIMVMILTKCKFGINLLLKYPRFFSGGFASHEGPSEEKQNAMKFSVTLCAEGWSEKLKEPTDEFTEPPNKAIVAKVSGRNPAYGATCVMLTLAAIVVITEPNKLPEEGGVFTPGVAFAKTTLIQQLQANGVGFEILSEKDL